MSGARRKPDSCIGCGCYSHGTDFSAVEGTGSSGVMLVGEASGEYEQRDQLPFRLYAPAGALLTRVLRRMGLDRAQFSITNVVRCRPRNNWFEKSPWEYAALRHCRPNLDAAIARHQPRVIVALGGIALRELTGMAGEAQGISHLAGYVVPLGKQLMVEGEGIVAVPHPTAPIPVIGDFHPAYLRRGKASHQGIFARILHRAMQIARGDDQNWLWGVDPDDPLTHGDLHYDTHPSVEDARAYYRRLLNRPDLPIIYDLETHESSSIDEDARVGFQDTEIRLIQFASVLGGAIALPWEDGFKEAARDILHLPNVKAGHNVWLFDNKVLRAAGTREGLDLEPRGTIHDTLQMFHHWQPDLPAHLQFCAQYVQFPFPWKHLAASYLEFYGCCDVDATLRLYTYVRGRLEAEGLWGDSASGTGYIGQVADVRPVLAEMEDRGLPVDDEARLALDVEFARAQVELHREIAAMAPAKCCRVHPKPGYKGVPPEVKAIWRPAFNYVASSSIWQTPAEEAITLRQFSDPDDDGECYHYEQRQFQVAVEHDGQPVTESVTRWCRVYDFNPNSWQQILDYMRAKGHPIPKSKETDDAREAKNTTAAKELTRLAHRTGDTFYLKVIEYRGLTKMRGTYVEGFKPATDGCVHTTFTFNTGIGQLSSRNPNVQNFPKLKPTPALAHAMRRMVAAKPGNVLTEWDFKSCHVLTLGFLAEDANYIRLARLDMHSFVAGHVLGLWDGPTILREPDDELRARFKWLKSDPDRKRVRDDQAKHAILGIGNGLKAKGLYERYMENFASQREAKRFLDVAEALFPKVFAWQRAIQQRAHDQQRLVTEFGHIRRFFEVFRWDVRKGAWGHGDQAEEAISFWLSNIAFGHIREAMKELRRRGLAAKYGLFDNIHDSFLFHFPVALLEEHVAEIAPVLRLPSRILRHPTIAPEGLVIDVEAGVGERWSDMREIPLPRLVLPEAVPV